MQELARKIEAAAKGDLLPLDEWDSAACAWATCALRNHRGELLRLALKVSEAMVEYAAELEGRDKPSGPPGGDNQ